MIISTLKEHCVLTSGQLKHYLSRETHKKTTKKHVDWFFDPHKFKNDKSISNTVSLGAINPHDLSLSIKDNIFKNCVSGTEKKTI